ncbi:hypothetical protein N0V88_006292 [Collariella sp. IMI 366227]|nr:hypothetical protein N0V88_006292 [Collariella sp. IMI 366227]
MIFGTAEPATIIMAASMPILRTLISRKPTEPKPVQFIDLDRRTTRSTASKRNLATGSPAPDPL